MSTAELTARRIYDSYSLHSLSDDVRRCLAILCIGKTKDENSEKDESALVLSKTEKIMRAKQALIDAKLGNTCSTDELCKSIDSKYPWIC